MSITLPTGDSNIDGLLADLTTLVGQYGKSSYYVEQFLEEHKNDSWTDRHTGNMHRFSEIGELLAELMEGITNHEGEDYDDEGEEVDTADWWKNSDDSESWKG